MDAATPIERLSLSPLGVVIVEALPRVASASVSVSYPSTVVIAVTESVAAGYVTNGAGYALVDRTGRAFDTVSAKPALPQLFASGAAADNRATLGALATVAAALGPVLRKAVLRVAGDDPDHITLALTAGRTAIWGTSDQSAAKATVLTALLHRSGTTFDVSDPGYVVVR